MKYRVKNWSKFQHYRDRNPPWIKLHLSILSSCDWVILDDKSRVLAVASMLLASKSNGEIDGSRSGLEYMKRVAYLKTLPTLKPLIECGFLVPLADASNLQANDTPETETEKEKRKDSLIPPDLKKWEPVIEEWIKYKREQKKPYTETGLKNFFGRFRKFPPEKREEALRISMASGYQGFFEPNGSKDSSSTQSEEKRIGIAYAKQLEREKKQGVGK